MDRALDLRGQSQCLCRSCEEIFATLSDFDRHRRGFACMLPELAGLEQANGVWGTSEGNANRAVKAVRLRSLRKTRG